jgi:hypothetical protein
MIKFTKKKKMLLNKFYMKDLFVVDVILENKISKTFNELILSQSHYIEQSFDKFYKGYNSIVKHQ